MTDVAQKRRIRWRLWIAVAGVALLVAATIVPPMISINRYKGQIAELVSQSLGRPVHLSGVELRLLPRPSFVLSNLVVEEDPAYGAEPVLHAESVSAHVRLLALWRGRLEISSISVDSASLNLVRMPGGRWNLDPLFRTAAAKAGAAAGRETRDRHAPRLPYLEATESRINFKNGVEKLPFSIVNAELSFWEESPGDWHLRLRGQPARTDVSLFQEDTGIVRLDASVHSAPALRDMPLHVDLDWREAQLGQLSRLLTGSDPGWRGNLTANLHLDGTPETARVTARLQAAGVHRAEFAPAEPLDFDANCSLIYHYPNRALENLACDSPLGDGRVRVTGDLPGGRAAPHFTVSLDHMPVDAAMAFLRTVRSGIDPGLSASGTISGKMSYSGISPAATAAPRPATTRRRRKREDNREHPAEPITGGFTISGFQLSGGGLDHPIEARHFVLQPQAAGPGEPQALAGTAEVPAGGPSPLTVTPLFTMHGYELSIRGQATLAYVRQFADLAGMAGVKELSALTGGPVSLALDAHGPWVLPEPAEIGPAQAAAVNQPVMPASTPDGGDPAPPPNSAADTIAGTLTVHDANWKPDYLAHSVVISQATLHFGGDEARWDQVDFSFGPLKASGAFTLPKACSGDEPCPAHFQLQFGKVDAAELQSAILGARPHTSLFDSLIDRLHLSSAPAWPSLEGTVQAESVTLGPVTMQDPAANLKIDSTGATITSLDARVLEGEVHASGSFTKPESDQGRPVYALQAAFSNLSAPAVGRLLDMRWVGDAFDAEGKIEVSGLTARELAATAKGTMHFEWRRGTVESIDAPRARTSLDATKLRAPGDREIIPPQLNHFSSFSGDAEIAGGKITLEKSDAMRGGHEHPVNAQLIFGEPPRITFNPAEPAADSRAQVKPAPHESARK
ncbi:MAG: AsmA family protein [Terracidiphilus sp.]